MEKSHVFLDIAGLRIDFCTSYPEYVRQRCAKYLAAEWPAQGPQPGQEPVLCLEATDEDIRKADRDHVGEAEAELYAMTIPLSEQCPALGRLMTHGVAIECDGRGFIFTAESGVGKSTHAFLWQKYLGADRVRVINGDKPIIRFLPDGQILACGSPWSGKEHLDENVQVPLKGICLLSRLADEPAASATPAKAPYIVPATREEAFDFLMHQVFIPSGAAGQLQTLRLLERLCDRVPVYRLVVDMSREAVEVSSGRLLNTVQNDTI